MGKTLAFGLPLVERVRAVLPPGRARSGRAPTALIMAPTRELAQQVAAEVESVAPSLVTLCVYGGTPMGPSCTALRSGVDVLVGIHGSGLNNAIFMRPGAALVQLLPWNLGRRYKGAFAGTAANAFIFHGSFGASTAIFACEAATCASAVFVIVGFFGFLVFSTSSAGVASATQSYR